MAKTGYYNAEAAETAREDISFSFGENWKRFLGGFDEPRLLAAERSFLDFTSLDGLHGQQFLDVGSGSGLSSLVAIRLGARRVVSIDVDPHSIDCALALRERFQIPSDRWEVHQGSALDLDFMESLGKYSYVHSWGGARSIIWRVRT
jgi:SAM-dependent methyltransferase